MSGGREGGREGACSRFKDWQLAAAEAEAEAEGRKEGRKRRETFPLGKVLLNHPGQCFLPFSPSLSFSLEGREKRRKSPKLCGKSKNNGKL